MSDAVRRATAAAHAAGPASLVGLHRAVKARVEEIAAAFWGLSTKTTADYGGTTRAPVVYDGYIPPKTAGDSGGEQFPNIIVSTAAGTDTPPSAEQASTATVDLFIGTYSDTDDGWLDVLAVIDAIRLSFWSEPVLLVRGRASAYEHVGPLQWTIPDEQKRPQWRGVCTLQFQLPRPERVEARNPVKE